MFKLCRLIFGAPFAKLYKSAHSKHVGIIIWKLPFNREKRWVELKGKHANPKRKG